MMDLDFTFFSSSMQRLNLIGKGKTTRKVVQQPESKPKVEPVKPLNSPEPSPSKPEQEPLTAEEEIEVRDKFETQHTTFYKVLTTSFYEAHLDPLKQLEKQSVSSLKSSTKRDRKFNKDLKQRKKVISSPSNFRKVDNELCESMRKMADQIGELKKSASLDNLLRDSVEFSSSMTALEKGKLMFGSVQDLSYSEVGPPVYGEVCLRHERPVNLVEGNNVEESISSLDSKEVENNGDAQATELLKSFSDANKGQPPRPQFSKFPIDDGVAIRNDPDIRRNRRSKTTDFDVAGKKSPGTTHLKNFEVRGLVKMELNSRNVIFNVKDDSLIYENEVLIRYNNRTRKRDIICQKVVIKSVRYQKSKESTAVELRDTKNVCYILKFEKLDAAKKFMENEQVLEYITDNKVGLMHSLRKLLGKRASQEYLEKKGIYKPEPFFGNTLKDITNCTSQLVPAFVTETIKLLERPENIKSLGLYRTSGNLATIQKIRLEVDKNNLNILNEYDKDPDVLTGSLKLFFRELKEPLITYEVCDKLLQYTKQNPDTFAAKEHQKIRSILLNNLHESNLETFVTLMRHLLEVIKYKEHNKMDSYNLAVCWGPSMVFNVTRVDDNPTIESCRDIVCLSQNATRMVDFFLTYYEQYPAELGTLGKRTKLDVSEKVHTLRRQESRESDWSLDSSRSSQKKSGSNLSLSIDEVIKSLVDYIQPHIHTQQLYKKPGSSDKTNKIMKKLNKKKIKELEKYKNDVPELTDALKKYLKDHDSLITDDAVESVLKITSDNTENYLKPVLRHQVISKIEETPKKDTLIFLLRHLADVVKSQEDSKEEVIKGWAVALYKPKKNKVSVEDVEKFLSVAIKAFNDDLPDVVRSSFENAKGSSPIKNWSMDELMKEMKHHQSEQAGRDRNSRYDNVDSDDNLGDVGEASILDEDKTEYQTRL